MINTNTTYYGLWDTDELYDIRKDPKTTNLIADPQFRDIAKQFENQLYTMLEEQGAWPSPQPAQRRFPSKTSAWRLEVGNRHRISHHLVVPEPINRNAQ